MIPNPVDYDITPEIIRKRLSLNDNTQIFQSGVEHMFNDVTKQELIKCYDKAALLIRTFPDFIIKEGNQTYLVEAKQKTNSVEAIGLYFNKQRERDGVRVIYSFPNLSICASLIPMETIEVPLKYREQFNKYLKDLFVEENCVFNYWSNSPVNGSGDPFVRLDEGDLMILSEAMS